MSHPTKSQFTNRIHLALCFIATASLAGCVADDDSSADNNADNSADSADSSTDEGPVDEAELFTHPEEDIAGSQIRLIEGEDAPVVEAFVTQTPGLDVSSYQGNVNWTTTRSHGARFAYIKATQGTTYRNANFSQQYTGSYNAGIIRGAYHFATPNTASGAAQATYFVNHGGGWSRDGKTLPPALDLEYNPYGSACYGKTHAQMVAWIRDFAKTMKTRTGRDVVFYTSTSWWTLCTGNNASFGNNPLWIPRYGSSVGALPASWRFETIWQYADHGTFPGDQNRFNGDFSRVKAFAL